MFVCCECCVLSGRGLCDELITRPEESYQMWCVVVCDLEPSRMKRPWPALGRSATKKKYIYIYNKYEHSSLMGRDAASLVQYFPTFRRLEMSLSSESSPRRMDCLTLKKAVPTVETSETVCQKLKSQETSTFGNIAIRTSNLTENITFRKLDQVPF